MNRVEQIWLAQEKTYNEMMENDDQYCHPESFRWGFEQGVDWAEKDLALTWEDVKAIVETADMMVSEANRSPQELIQKYPTEDAYYTEVLNRFNKSKEKR